jgi:hypothetical protein
MSSLRILRRQIPALPHGWSKKVTVLVTNSKINPQEYNPSQNSSLCLRTPKVWIREDAFFSSSPLVED